MRGWAPASGILLLATLAGCDGASTSGPASPSPPPSAAPLPPDLLAAAFPPRPSSTAAPPLSPLAAAHLAKDLQDRIDGAKSAPYGFKKMQVVAGTFVVFAGDDGAPLDAVVDLTQRMTDAMYAGPFDSHRLDTSVGVWVYSSHYWFTRGLSVHIGVDKDLPGLGVYDPGTGQIVVRTDAAGVGSVAHELVHPMILADMPHVPTWLAEGISSLYEIPVFVDEPGKPPAVHGAAHFRLQTLRDALTSGKPAVVQKVSVDRLFTLSSADSFYVKNDVDLSELNYACAREFVRMLDQRGQLWPWYHRYRDGLLEDPSGDKALKAVTGKTPAEMTADFVAWIDTKQAEGVPR